MSSKSSTKRLSNNKGIKIFRAKTGKFNVKRLSLKKTNFERTPSNAFGVITIDTDELKRLLGGRISFFKR